VAIDQDRIVFAVLPGFAANPFMVVTAQHQVSAETLSVLTEGVRLPEVIHAQRYLKFSISDNYILKQIILNMERIFTFLMYCSEREGQHFSNNE
jgi:hypothetical protein